MSKSLDAKQERFLKDLQEGKRTTDVLFKDHDVSPDELDAWLKHRGFKRRIDAMRRVMKFRFEDALCRGAALAMERIQHACSGGSNGFPRTVDMHSCINAVKLYDKVVLSPEAKVKAESAMARAARRRAEAALPPGHHRGHTAEQAAALLERLKRREDRQNKLDPDQDDDGRWVPSD